uniref:Uncharacterized protein n=1 Tax=Rhizophora mucronata TaxID=61149 RepID=A0A2P2MZ77_RHIMU
MHSKIHVFNSFFWAKTGCSKLFSLRNSLFSCLNMNP